MHRHLAVAISLCLTGGLAGCADRLPDQDLRILSATPVAKMSADILWKEYQDNRPRADQRYRGKAIEITGVVTASADAPGARQLSFAGSGPNVIRANLLDDQAVRILARVAENKRITLKCFCDGLSGDLVLRSCVLPGP
jgi:hypothetical protein